ncbi:high choriolytic enzyme 1-like [Poecilia latipinna]|uniref:Metalloendopeptidase n=2 Tax=Poecilia TaxID=8080 RepID=A0A087XXK4_POEFO|nr:PREDICTED: high choriolytic enzyme 1-like [Poecilia formosa]XP_014879735.1 PREDICTED: high choriolytic enzyme 1-like [Poecilia latipinna]
MTPAFIFFFFFISVMDVCLSAPAEMKNQTDEFTDDDPRPKVDLENLVLHGDVAVTNTFFKNADPCTARGCKWPKSGRYVNVPYQISSEFSQQEKNIILRGMQSFHQTTCIRFVPKRSDQRDYIHFFSQRNGGCWSYIGRQRGQQYISLERRGCVHHSTVQHEILHALGFHHEQVRSDRDRYVRILFNNIQQRQRGNFKKVQTNNLVTPYDFTSVMHYGKYDFTSNGQPTIEAKSNPNQQFGNARQMSANDITRVNRLYECNTSRRQYRY